MSASIQELLISYMLGDLDAEQQAEVEARLAHEPELQREMEQIEESFCAMALDLPPEPPSAQARQRLFDALEPTARFEPFVDRLMDVLDMARTTVLGLLASLDDPATLWEDGPCEGTKLIHLATGPRFAGAVAGFVQIEPGVVFPHHKHLGRERVIVLQGGLRDMDGTVWSVGQEQVMEDDTEHDFVALADGPPLIYVVTLDQGVEYIGLK